MKQVLKSGGQLFARRQKIMSPIRQNMQNRLVVLGDKLVTRKRLVIETIVGQLKNISMIEHRRHRSTTNFIVNLFAELFAYTWQAKKPTRHLPDKDVASLPTLI